MSAHIKTSRVHIIFQRSMQQLNVSTALVRAMKLKAVSLTLFISLSLSTNNDDCYYYMATKS